MAGTSGWNDINHQSISIQLNSPLASYPIWIEKMAPNNLHVTISEGETHFPSTCISPPKWTRNDFVWVNSPPLGPSLCFEWWDTLIGCAVLIPPICGVIKACGKQYYRGQKRYVPPGKYVIQGKNGQILSTRLWCSIEDDLRSSLMLYEEKLLQYGG